MLSTAATRMMPSSSASIAASALRETTTSTAFTARVLLSALILIQACLGSEPRMSDERIVFETDYGAIEFGLYPDVAPATAKHILKLAKLGGYNTNHFFRRGLMDGCRFHCKNMDFDCTHYAETKQ